MDTRHSTDYHVEEGVPSVAEYGRLRQAVGWSELPFEAIEAGLVTSLYGVCAFHEGELVGCGRVVGDGGIYYYVQDIIVLPRHQRRGVGTRIMERILDYLGENAHSGAFVGLMAALGTEGFYTRFGFQRRPDDRPGMFLVWGNRAR
jgi:GNAT superfamily N-acetyltransferase